MRVLMNPATPLISNKIGSVPEIGYNIINRLCNNGIKIYAITKKVLIEMQIPNLSTVEVENFNPLTIYKVSKYLMKKKEFDILHHFFMPWNDYNIFFLLERHKVHIPLILGPIEGPHKIFPDEFPWIFGKISNLKAILIRISHPSFNIIRNFLMVETLKRADIVIAATYDAKNILSKFIDKKRIKVIYYGVDLNKFKYFTPPENYNILTVGNHIRRKGFEYLIFAMKLVTKEFPEAKLYITSDGPRRSYLENLVRKLKLTKNVIFTGRVPEEQLLNLYKNCRLFVHPSLSESFSPVRLEAMAVGRPIIATEVTGSREMISHGKDGFLVKPKDYKTLAEYISQLLDDYELCVKIGKNARKKVEEKFDWDKNIKEYLKLYKRMS